MRITQQQPRTNRARRAWIRDVLSSRGEEWQGARGTIFLSETGTPMFRPEDPAKKPVPLSDFDGFTQP